jgi:hypothetical protein
MNDGLLKFYQAAKALILYVDQEYVFDKSADMGCGGLDAYQSDTFRELIADAKRALDDLEVEIKAPLS